MINTVISVPDQDQDGPRQKKTIPFLKKHLGSIVKCLEVPFTSSWDSRTYLREQSGAEWRSTRLSNHQTSRHVYETIEALIRTGHGQKNRDEGIFLLTLLLSSRQMTVIGIISVTQKRCLHYCRVEAIVDICFGWRAQHRASYCACSGGFSI